MFDPFIVDQQHLARSVLENGTLRILRNWRTYEVLFALALGHGSGIGGEEDKLAL